MGPLRKIEEEYDTYKLVERRLKTLIGRRWKDINRMEKAANTQDILRKKFGMKVEGWNSTNELRKWRNAH